jgi:heme-degrading monooxygenase HmoA
MSPEQYDQASERLIPELKKQPGFVSHAAFQDGDVFTVSEIWESREQHDRWFEGSVKPNVPAEIKVEAIDVHNVVAP